MIIHGKDIIVEEDDIYKIISKILGQAYEINSTQAAEAERIVFNYLPPNNTYLGKYIHMAYKLVEIEKKPEPYY